MLQKLMEAEPDGSSLHQLAQWGHDILSTNSRGSARPARCSNQMGPLITV